MRQRIISEAERTSQNIENETKKTIEIELERAKKQLYEEVLDKALGMSKDTLVQKVNAEDHQRLQKEFQSNIGAGA